MSVELKHIFKNRYILIPVCLAVLVPLIYAMIMLSPKWGPYDNTDNLPVAVVNNDLGAVSEGKKINIGESLLTSLKENNVLGWEFVSAEEAQIGMKNMQYYMTIEVPKDFSKQALTVLDDEPVKPKLKFTQNEGLHFMAAQVTNKAAETLKSQLSSQITATYVENVILQLKEVANGFTDGADGAEQINDGTEELKNGSEQILGSLTEKNEDIGRLANGAQELNMGTGTLLDSLQGKSSDISRLADGASEINNGTYQLLQELNNKSPDINRLAEGASELAGGTSELQAGATDLLEGANQAKSGSAQLMQGFDEEILPGSVELAAGVQEAQAGVNETIESMENLQAALEQLPNSVDGLENNTLYRMIMGQLNENLKTTPQKQQDFQRLVDGANALRDGLKNDFNTGLISLNNGLSELADGQKQLKAGVDQLASGSKEVAAGNKTVATGWNALQTNVAKLHDGTNQLKNGNASVEQGWNELTTGALRLHDGSSQVSEGNQTVKAGWLTLTNGVSQVDDGLEQLAGGSKELQAGLQAGAKQTSSIDPEEDNIAMFAEPVALDGEVINSFPFYRDANAPYILTLALYVGVLVMSFVVQYRKPVTFPPSALTWFTGKTVKLSLLTIIQASIISLYTLFVLQLDVQSSFWFILFSIGVSLAFLMIVLFLVGLAGNIGRFIALVFVVLQLSTTGSSLPIDMLPEGLRQLSAFLPFTYSIESYRSIITLGITSNMWENISVLFLYFIIFAVLTLIVFFVRYRFDKKQIEHQANINESVS